MVSTQNTGMDAQSGTEAERYEMLSTRFNRIVKRTQAAIVMERLWPCTIAPLYAAGAFLTTSWFGLWAGLPPMVRMGGVAAFAFAGAVSFIPLIARARTFNVSKREAVARLDIALGDPRQPARMLNDRVNINNDAIQREVWRLNRLQLLTTWIDRISAAKTTVPAARLPFVTMGASLVVAAAMAGPGRLDRISEAFNWHIPPAPTEVKAWIVPPKNFDEGTGIVLTRDTKNPLAAHESSTMTIVIFDKDAGLSVNGIRQTLTKANIVKDGAQEKSTFQYDVKLGTGKNTITVGRDIQWQIDVLPDNAPTATIETIAADKEQPGVLIINGTERDDYGVTGSDVVMTPKIRRHPDATPLAIDGITTPEPR